MRTAATAAFGLAALLFAREALAQIVFYENEYLRGRVFSTDRPVDNFARSGFNGRASSAVVERGQWLVCEDPHYRGRCVTLRPGQYNTLGALQLYNRIASARPVNSPPPRPYAPPPPSAPAYGYYPHYGEPLFQANVVQVRTVVGPPQQRCWVEPQQVVRPNQPNIAGAVLGGVLGGVLGHQVGSGRGNDWATAIGAIGGAAVGANVNRQDQVATQNVQHCDTVPGSARPEYWDVTYVFRGQTHRAQLGFAPGATITVNQFGEPRV